ncbi:MAG: carbohydrate kinase [Bacteroidia bacterium]|nr:carbohydrate kinase [Bacteroidia bacterium]
MSQYLIGIDIGTSSIKASIVDASTGQTVSSAHSPSEEMTVNAVQPGWAEQHPDLWWEHTLISIKAAAQKAHIDPKEVAAIGISYQMHGLVMVDKEHKPLRPSIIWCDSRAVEIGEKAFKDLGNHYCLQHLLNSPGNFTASKLKWVKENEPAVYERIHKVMLPGDYIALKLTGEITTTETGLSEGIFWDYQEKAISRKLLEYYGIDKNLIASIVPVFSEQGKLRESVAKELGLASGIKIAYRAGDQPNNAFSLNVLNPGETAATAGTSGVIYSVTDTNAFDPRSRVNAFIHVNSSEAIRNGVLLCINGTGILNSWLKKNIRSSGAAYDYEQINAIASEAPIGADGLIVLPFGNGAERILENKGVKSSFHGLNFNRHNQSHLFRAAQEGIVFALKYGFDILQEMGLKTEVIRAGNANMFLSPLFREAFVNTIGARLELYDTDGAKGAALGAGVGAGVFNTFPEAFSGLKMIRYEEPDKNKSELYTSTYQLWKTQLNKLL